MKKLVTLILAMVMVLALAVPSFATYGWAQQPSTDAAVRLPGFEIAMTQYQFTPVTTGFDWQSAYYSEWTPTQAVVAGTNVRFVVTINAIAKSGITEAIVKDISTLRLTVESANLNINSASSLRYVENSATGKYEPDAAAPVDRTSGISNGRYSATIGDITDAARRTMTRFMFTAQVRETKNAEVTATLKCGASEFTSSGTYSFVKNGKNYTVKHDGNYFYVWNEETPLRVVRFTVDSASKVTDVHVSLADLASERVTSITPLTNKEQSALLDLIEAEYASVALNYATATDSVARGVSLYYRAYDLWEAAMLKTGLGHVTDSVFWTGDTPAYDKLTADGKKSFEAFIADVVANTQLTEADMAKPSDAALYQLGREYMLNQTSAAYQAKINELSTYAYRAAGAAPAADMYAPYAGKYTDPATGANYASAEKLDRAIINSLMQKNGYVYYVAASQYTGYTGSVFTGISVGSTFGRTTANIHGQVGKLSATSTVTAPYYRASYNVNNGMLTFGMVGGTLDAGYDMLLDGTGSVPANPGVMARLFGTETYPTVQTLADTFNAGSALPKGDAANGTTNVPVYGQIDSVRAKEGGFALESAYLTSGSVYDALKATFTEINDVLGFVWDGTTSYMYENAFLANFAGTLSITASAKYLSYTGSLVVTDPNAQPPQTGDGTTVTGFVMLGLALAMTITTIVIKKKAND